MESNNNPAGVKREKCTETDGAEPSRDYSPTEPEKKLLS